MHAAQKAHPFLLTLIKIQRKYKKDYSFPSQEKIIELMHINQGYKKSRATINRWLRVVEDSKYLVRRRRIKRHRLYGMCFKSTLYKVTIKGYSLMTRLGVDMSKEIARYQKWLEEINPDRGAVKTRKKLDSAERNPEHTDNIQKILNSLAENLSVP